MEKFNVIINRQDMNNNDQCLMNIRLFADSSRMFDFPRMDSELGNYNVSRLLRQSRHKEQS